MKLSPLAAVGGLLLLSLRSHAEIPEQQARAIDASTKGKESPKVAGKLVLRPDGYSAAADLTFFRAAQGKVVKVVALSEGESAIRWTVYFRADKPIFATLIEESRNGSTREKVTYAPGGALRTLQGSLTKNGKVVKMWTKPQPPRTARFYAEIPGRLLAQKGSK